MLEAGNEAALLLMLQVADAVYGNDLVGGFAVPPLIRFVGAEDAYLVRFSWHFHARLANQFDTDCGFL